MIKKVGFSRALKVEWLNTAVEIYENTRETDKAEIAIKEYLSDKINGQESRRKCFNILMAAWVNVPESNQPLRDSGLELYNISDNDDKIVLHWGALMMAFPIFTDVASTVGRLLFLNESFQLATITKRVYEIWGERDTVKYATEKIIATMKEFGVISRGKKPGEYKRGKFIVIENLRHKLFLVNSYMLAADRATLQYDTIEGQYPLFPFKIDLKTHEINESDTLKLNRFDNQIFIMMN